MKVAWFTPFAPDSSVGDYSQAVTEALAVRIDVDVWAGGDGGDRPTSLPVIDYVGVPAFLGRLTGYDAIVYNVANGPAADRYLYEVAAAWPGLVVLHDVILQRAVARHLIVHRRSPALYVETMTRFYGAEGRAAAEASLAGRRPAVWESESEAARFPLWEQALANAEGVVVHSEAHEALVRRSWRGPVRRLHPPGGDARHREAGAAAGTLPRYVEAFVAFVEETIRVRPASRVYPWYSLCDRVAGELVWMGLGEDAETVTRVAAALERMLGAEPAP